MGLVDPAWLEANRCADQWADKARALDAIPAGERTKIKKVDKLSHSTLLFAAESLEQNVKAPGARHCRKRPLASSEPRTMANDRLRTGLQTRGHHTVVEGTGWRCSRCNCTWQKATVYARTKSGNCAGRPLAVESPRTRKFEITAKRYIERLEKRSEGRLVHSLRYAGNRWVCLKCGKFNAHYPAALGQVCPLKPTNAKARRLVEELAETH